MITISTQISLYSDLDRHQAGTVPGIMIPARIKSSLALESTQHDPCADPRQTIIKQTPSLESPQPEAAEGLLFGTLSELCGVEHTGAESEPGSARLFEGRATKGKVRLEPPLGIAGSTGHV
jgi:hypothetical protein